MAEAASLAFAVISLLDSSLTACRAFSTGDNFSTDSESLCIALLWQQSRLKTWAKTWQIPVEGDVGAVSSSPAVALLEQEAKEAHVDLKVIERTLKSMKDLLLEGEKLSSRHLTKEEAEKEIRYIPEKFKGAWNRVRWVATDMDRLALVVSNLRSHNSELEQIRPRGDIISLASQQTTTASEALATLATLGLSFPRSPMSSAQYELELRQILSMIKHQSDAEAMVVQPLDKGLAITEWKDKISFYNGPSSVRQVAHFIQGHDRFRTEHEVLVEWKAYAPTSVAQSLAMERTDRVARLLSNTTQPEDLRILQCVAYYQDIAASRCGILFQLPTEFSGKCEEVMATSLLDLYRRFQGPSLSERVQLAWMLTRSMLKFHLFQWLHKDFRSENIVFFHLRKSEPNIRSPYVASFGLARPDGLFLASESGYNTDKDKDALRRALAYCHPDYEQSTEQMRSDRSNRRRYHRAFDVYSLGCVLLEIGLWQPLESLGWSSKYSTRPRTEWQKVLIKTAGKHLGFMCGPAYRDIVVRCLGSRVEGEDRENEKIRDFSWMVVRLLENIRV